MSEMQVIRCLDGQPVEVMCFIPRVMIADIQTEVARHYGIPVPAMTSAQRRRDWAHPRQLAMYLSSQLTGKSLPDIGRRFGGRDHTTVIHAIRQVEKRIRTDYEVARAALKVRETLA